MAACSCSRRRSGDYPAWGFAASFPGPPKETDHPASDDGAKAHTVLVETVTGGHDFIVTVSDASRAVRNPRTR